MIARTLLRRGSGAALTWETHWLPVGRKDVSLRVLLRRLLPAPAKPQRAVLLVPGANSSCETFTIPGGGLAAYLAARGADVWMLDWRASPLVLNTLLERSLPSGAAVDEERRAFTLDRIVAEDLPAALTFIRQSMGGGRLAVHGHCVGGGGLATAIARGILEPFDVDRVVLSTLGLFYEVPWNTWIKAEDFLLENMTLAPEWRDCRAIDPRRPSAWPEMFGHAYGRWPAPWLPERGARSDEFLRQLSFMVGQPYSPDKLDPTIRGAPVEGVFGALHLGLYMHLGQMVRRGYSAPFNVRDQIDRARLKRGRSARSAPRGDFFPARFAPYHITLVAAGDNGVWHRDSIDLMYEWLLRRPGARCEKYVIPECNIQELYWAPEAPTKTYDLFARALAC